MFDSDSFEQLGNMREIIINSNTELISEILLLKNHLNLLN